MSTEPYDGHTNHEKVDPDATAPAGHTPAGGETPRTDAKFFLATPESEDLLPLYDCVEADFARQLERELCAAKAEIEGLKDDKNQFLRDQLAASEEARQSQLETIAELRADKERLDWLARQWDPQLSQDFESGEWGVSVYRGNRNDRELFFLAKEEYETIRAAIDAARAGKDGES